MKRALVLVAGGSGTRMGGALPKQYLVLEEKPVIVHTLEKFLTFDPDMEVVVVLADAHRPLWKSMVSPHIYGPGIQLASGGTSRFHSVKQGLELIGKNCIVGIHDAVRPLVSLDTLERTYAMAEKSGGAIPVIEMNESLRLVGTEGASEVADRAQFKRVQTPQVFRSELIKEAYRMARHADYTDDASVFEAFVGKINLVEGNSQNIKITTPTDLKLASLLIQSTG